MLFVQQGNMINFIMGTMEQREKITGKMGTRNISGNKGTKPFSEKEYKY